MRLFTGVQIEPGVGQEVVAAIDSLRSVPALASALKWVEPENLHITLHFLGEVSSDLANELVKRLVVPLDVRPPNLSLGEAAVFPGRGRPRGVWVGLRRGNTALRGLRDATQGRLTPLGFDSEGRPYQPHVTLGRRRRAASISRGALDERLRLVTIPSAEWRVRRVMLFESRPSPAGPIYRVVAETPLCG